MPACIASRDPADPIGKCAYFGYDDGDQTLWKLDGNDAVVYYSYDAAGRTTGVQYPSETAYFEYDALGSRVYLGNAASEVYYVYDALGRAAEVHDVTANKWLSYTYDETGNRLTLTGPEGATVHDPYNECARRPLGHDDTTPRLPLRSQPRHAPKSVRCPQISVKAERAYLQRWYEERQRR